jgi:hypothetical protein
MIDFDWEVDVGEWGDALLAVLVAGVLLRLLF